MIRAYRVTIETQVSGEPRARTHTRIVSGEDLSENAARRLALRRESRAHRRAHSWSSDIISVDRLIVKGTAQ